MLIQTSLGDLPLWSRVSQDRARPLVFAVQGLFSRADALSWLAEAVPAADIVLARLPGIQTPPLRIPGMAGAGAAYAEAVSTTFPGRRILPLGVSAGSLAVMAMCARLRTSHAVLVEPCLRPGQAWALRALLRSMKVEARPDLRVWVDEMLGVFSRPETDFSGLLEDLPRMTTVLVGDEPLEPRRADARRFPSLASEAERSLWQATPGVRLCVCEEAGHNIPDEARTTLARVMVQEVEAMGRLTA